MQISYLWSLCITVSVIEDSVVVELQPWMGAIDRLNGTMETTYAQKMKAPQYRIAKESICRVEVRGKFLSLRTD